ncbi:helix-turn-helix transcriptional regulator [Bacillus horti]|uniref:Transcriptional regulator with XRE-family HTH domain n=1 Tax=Caldalkalibacillus horti TaxID=77523 RepID=A0ABT9VX02_9BACI|nr:helix-turn-helix transcriptional regulator [Bacillus horti]MDQ0165425.1 transcriptional regulator with XRE-family HTH domain [Bacillus horti]
MIGQRIFFFRKSKGMTQEQLAKGICSISHLSKIENGHEAPSQDIITHLCHRLGINIEDVDSKEELEQITQLLEEWYGLMVNKERNEAKNIYPKIQEKMEHVQDPTVLLRYKLYYIRFCLMRAEYEEAEEKVKEFSQYEKSVSKELLYLFYFLQGILTYSKGEYSESLTFLKKAEEIAEKLRLIEAELYYMLALAHIQLHDITFSINFASQALELFQQNFQINRCLECEVLIGINNLRLRNYNVAEKHFLSALKVAKSLKYTELIYMNYHNLGYLHQKMNSSKAIHYFHECLKYFHSNEDEIGLKEEKYCQTSFSLAKEYYNLNDFKQMLEWVEKGEHMAFVHDLTTYILHFKVLRFRIEEQEDPIKESILKDEVIPYFVDKKLWIYVADYAQMLADIYYANHKYKSASQYYQLVIQANRNVLKF